jgi:predicted DNA binding CopG/RHH family protein
MKNSTKKHRVKRVPSKHDLRVISPEQAIDFLESFRELQKDKDEKTILISLRVPQNLLRALKHRAQVENRKYQSMIIRYIRQGLKNPL